MPDTLADAALSYARRGISVFPLKPRSKAPLTEHGLNEASADVDQVRRWWRKTPLANIGIATGAPAGFWVLDVDGEGAEAALVALEAQHGALPVTVQQQTGRGRHVCFRWDPEGPEMRNRAKVGGADIDVRGNGGYIVAPPSVHPGDPKKGIPPGRIYAWAWGRGPEDLAFADAPDWLVQLCRPRDQVAAATPRAPDGPRPAAGGRATRYGEVVLEACVRAIGAAQKGTRDSTLYRFACKAAGLVGTGHLELGYLREALLHAGRVHVPDAMTEAQLVRQVERAIAWGADHSWGPDPDSRKARPATRAAEADRAGPVQQAIARAAGVNFLGDIPPVSGRALRAWCELRGLNLAGLPGCGAYVSQLRQAKAGLVMPLVARPGDPPDGAALFALGGGGACLGLKGLSAGRVGVLAWPADCDQLLVTSTLEDAWALAEAAYASGDPMAVVVAPRLSTFAGAPLGDRWGRVDPERPRPDPARPAWTWPGMATVYLAVRRDLPGPELKARKALGGTQPVAFSGDAAARFWGGLAAAAWKAAGANAVRVMTPPGSAVGFCVSGGA